MTSIRSWRCSCNDRLPHGRFRHLTSALALTLCVVAGALAQSPGSAPTSAPAESPQLPTPTPIDAASLKDRMRVGVAGFTPAAGIDSRDEWLAGAVQEVLSRRLRRHPRLLVPSTDRIVQARRELREDKDPAWGDVCTALGIDTYITGTVGGDPDDVHVTLEIRRHGQDAPVAREELPPARILAVIDTATRWSLGALNVKPPAGAPGNLLLEPPCKSASALEYYIRALTAFREERARDTAHYLREALDFDPACRALLLLHVEVDLRVGSAPARRLAAARLAMLFELSRRAEDQLDLAATEITHGVLNGMEGGYDAALARFARALEIGREARDPYAQIAAMTSIANLYMAKLPPAESTAWNDERRSAFSKANYQQAAFWQAAVVTSLESLHDLVSLAAAYNKLALTYDRLGDDEQVLTFHQKTLETARQLNSRRGEATGLLLLSQWYVRQKRWDEARTAIDRCVELAPADARTTVTLARASILRGMGQSAEALAQFQSVLESLRKEEDLTNQLLCLREIATLQWEQKSGREAISAMQEAIDIAHALGLPVEKTLQEQIDAWRKETPQTTGKPAAPTAQPKEEKPTKPEPPAPKKNGAAPKNSPKKPK